MFFPTFSLTHIVCLVIHLHRSLIKSETNKNVLSQQIFKTLLMHVTTVYETLNSEIFMVIFVFKYVYP